MKLTQEQLVAIDVACAALRQVAREAGDISIDVDIRGDGRVRFSAAAWTTRGDLNLDGAHGLPSVVLARALERIGSK